MSRFGRKVPGSGGRGRSRTRGDDATGDERDVVISEVRPDPAKPGCIAVRARGYKPWRIDDDAATELDLRVGQRLDAPTLARLRQAAANCAGRLKLQTRLAVRPLSRMEAMVLLRRAGAEPEAAKRITQRFEQLGWINDSRLATNVASNEAAKPVGRMRVVARVARRGINSGEARKAADAAVAARRESPLELAIIAARSQIRKVAPGLDADTRKRRVLGFLARRGFDEHTAREAVKAVMGKDQPSIEDD